VSALANTGEVPVTEWLSIREASALVGVSVATLRRWIAVRGLRTQQATIGRIHG